MKKFNTSTLLIIFLMIGSLIFAQSGCLVLKPEIAGNYSGNCKKGLAHGKGKSVGKDTYEGQFSKGQPEGKGIYTWSTGEVHTGEWKFGMREGEGIYKFKQEGRDTMLIGIWERDEYIGPKPIKPRVITRLGVDRYVFKRMSDIKNRVLIDFYRNGTRNPDIENFMIVTSSGYETTVGQSVGYEGMDFPVIIRLNYDTWNNFRTAKNYIIFEFEISEPGDWKVEVHN